MKMVVTSLILFLLFSLNTFAQDYTQWGVKAWLGKGYIGDIQYSPDGTRLAIASPIGIWLYNMATYREVSTGAADVFQTKVAFVTRPME